ncbi:MAG: hypothetical protein K0S38_254 [Candidatus Paceibacter sp.]|jgi:hypothetical protein|nr:hypothetical protein [Candidatus Paceibacter sp.]
MLKALFLLFCLFMFVYLLPDIQLARVRHSMWRYAPAATQETDAKDQLDIVDFDEATTDPIEDKKEAGEQVAPTTAPATAPTTKPARLPRWRPIADIHSYGFSGGYTSYEDRPSGWWVPNVPSHTPPDPAYHLMGQQWQHEPVRVDFPEPSGLAILGFSMCLIQRRRRR